MPWYQPLLYLWVAPASLLGLTLLPVACLQGGRAALVDGAIEVHGGFITWFLQRLNVGAMTLGHVIWGTDPAMLERTRAHEHVHIDQYERWGPLFIPLLFGFAVVLYCRGKDPYWDNPFEVEAYAKAP